MCLDAGECSCRIGLRFFLFFSVLIKGQARLVFRVITNAWLYDNYRPYFPPKAEQRSREAKPLSADGKESLGPSGGAPSFFLNSRRTFPILQVQRKKASILFKNESYSHSSRPNSRPDNLKATITRDIIARDGNGLRRHLSSSLFRRPRALTDKQMKYFARDDAPFNRCDLLSLSLLRRSPVSLYPSSTSHSPPAPKHEQH